MKIREVLQRTVGHPAGFLGLAAMVFAAAWISEIVNFNRRAILAESEIINVSPGQGKAASSVSLRYVYQDAAGRTWRGAAGYSGQPISVGQRLGVLYDPLNPGTSVIEGGLPRWIIPMPLFALGAVLVVVGWIVGKQKTLADPRTEGAA